MEESAAMSPPPVARAEIVVDLAAIRHNVRDAARSSTGDAQMMTVVKADGYGHGMVEVARAAREAGAEWLGVATIDEALALRAAGDTGRVLCWLTVPGEDYAAAIAADVDVTAYSVAELDEIAAARRRRRPPGPGPAQGRHRPLPRRRAARRLAGRSSPRARAGEEAGTLAGHRHLVALRRAATSPTTPPTTPRSGLPRRARRRRGGRAAARGAPPGQLGGGAPAARRPASTWCACGLASYGLDPAPGPHARPRPGARDDRARPPRADQADRRRRRRLLRPHLDRRARTRRVGLVPVGYGDGVPRARQQRAPRPGRRQAPAGPRPGLHGPVRRRPRAATCRGRRRGRALRHRAATASRPPRTGPRRAAPSPTRSSPGSAAG